MRIYPKDDTIIYGISYGTYYLNTYLNLFPNQINAAILDGICPPDKCRTITYDKNSNMIGMYFMNLCGNDKFCQSQLTDDPNQLFAELYASAGNYATGTIPCIDIGLPIIYLKAELWNLLLGISTRILIPPILFRMMRCNDDDKQVLNYLFDRYIGWDNVSFPNRTFDTRLGENIMLSEMWNGMDYNDPGPTYEELLLLDENYYISAGIFYIIHSINS